MIAKLEQFVRRVIQDQAFRELAVREPEQAVAGFGLVGPERVGALKLCAQLGGSSDYRPMGWWW